MSINPGPKTFDNVHCATNFQSVTVRNKSASLSYLTNLKTYFGKNRNKLVKGG